jgi:O-antigen ligase
MATEQLSWRAPAPRGPVAVLGPILFGLSFLALALALSSSAYLGQAKVGLALVIAAGGFVAVLAQPIVALMVLISTTLLTYPDALAGQGLLTINNLLGVTLVLLMLVRIFLGQEPWFLRQREIQILAGLFFAFLFLTIAAEALLPKVANTLVIETKSGIFRPVRDLTAMRFKDFFSRVAFLIFLVYFVSTKKHIKLVMLAFLGCILVALPAAFANLLSNTANDARITAGFDIGGGAGWLSNENRFAFMCLLGMSILFYFISITKNRFITLIASLLMVAFTTLIFLSGSRSGVLSLVISGGWLLTRQKAISFPARLATLILIGVVSIVLFFTLPVRLQERLLNLNPFNPQGEGSHSTEVRVATLVESIGMFARYPLTGVGIGNFRWINLYYNNNFKPPHNSYLWALSEGGLFCFLLYMVLFRTLAKRIREVRQLFRDDPELPYIGEWLSFYFITFLFFSFFADVWLEEIHLYMLTGLAIILHRLITQESSNGPRPTRIFY